MTTTNLGDTAQALVADGKGILAADETVPTVTKRLAALTIESTPESRRDYREMFFTTPGSPSSSAASSCRMRRSTSGAREELRWSMCWPRRGSCPASR